MLVLCSLGGPFEDTARRRGFALHPNGLDETPEADLEEVRALVIRSGVAVDRAFLARLPALRHVIRAGSGVDNIDQAELAARSISLAVRKAASADAVAEVALAGLASPARRPPLGQGSLRAGRWDKSDLVGDVLAGVRVVVWGAGPVGRACAARLRPLVGNVSFVAWHSARDVPSLSRDEAVATADAHVLALPLRQNTRQLFDAELLGQMAAKRPHLINIGRLDLMDREAVLAALRDDGLRGVYIDAIDAGHVAWAAEALAGEPLNLWISPHLGAQRSDVLDTLGGWVLDELEGADLGA
ncbi:hypothetical protein BH24CHL9_BH24CHL9_03710 [soil metagenome]